MATRAAIASADRKSRENIAQKEREMKERQFKKSHRLAEFEANSKHLANSAKATKDLVGATSGLSGLISNDPKWYKKFNLSEFASNLPTFYRLGMELAPQWLTKGYDDVVTGIASIIIFPTLPNNNISNVPGSTAYQHSPINQTLTRFMAELRKLNSRIGDYDPSDIGLYWYSIEGLMYEIVPLVKALKAYNTYYSSNRYLSKLFIKSCGFDPDDFFANVQQYKAAVQRWISIFNANAVIPDSLDFLKRAYWLASTVVKDHKEDNAQLYHFVMPYNMSLAEDETYVSISGFGNDHTYATYVTRVDGKIQNLFNSVGIVTMTADLRAAFPESKLLKLPEFKSDEMLTYSTSMHDLEQIHNLRSLPMGVADLTFGEQVTSVLDSSGDLLTRLNIIVDANGYLAQGAFSSGNLLPTVWGTTLDYPTSTVDEEDEDNNFLNFYDSEFISDDTILEATRLRTILHAYNSTWQGYGIKYCGTEIVRSIMLLTARTDADDCYINEVWTDYTTGQVDVTAHDFRALCHLSTFDWFPWIKYYVDDGEELAMPNTLGELDHTVYLSNLNLKILHEACTYSLFYVDNFSSAHVA